MTALVMLAVGEFRVLHWCCPMPACISGNKLWHPDGYLIWCPRTGFRPAHICVSTIRKTTICILSGLHSQKFVNYLMYISMFFLHNSFKYKLSVNTISVLLGNLLCTVWVNMGCLVFSGVHSAYRRQSSPGPYWRISFKGIRSEDPGFHSATRKSFRSYGCPIKY